MIGRILYVVLNMEIAGAQRMVIDMALYLKRIGEDIHVLVLSDDPHNHFSKALLDNKISTRYVNLSNSKIKNSIKRFIAINEVVKEFKPSIIHSHLDYKYLWVYALLHNVRIVATFHTQPYRLNTRSFRFIYTRLVKKRLIIPVNLTKSNAEEFSDLFSTKVEDQVVIPNPIDLSEYRPLTIRSSDGQITICFAARFHSIKNHEMLLRAFHKLLETNPDIQLLLAGEGETKKDMEYLSESLGIDNKVRFLGNVSDIPRLLHDVDIGVISSDSESFSIFLLECMAVGLPVVLTHVGGMRDIIDGNGIFVNKGNIDQMTDALKTLVDDRTLRKKMGEKGLELVKQYDVSAVGDKYMKLYRNVLETSNK